MIYDSSDYGLSGFQLFRNHLDELRQKENKSRIICLQSSSELKDFRKNIKFIRIKKWKKSPHVTGVVLFVHRFCKRYIRLYMGIFRKN